jgi:hypothetical protein
MGLLVTEKHYEHLRERDINANGITVMWDVSGITDRTVLANQPDIELHDKKENTWWLISIAKPDDSNNNTKETEKLNNYKDLEIDVSRMWKLTKIVPVVLEH